MNVLSPALPLTRSRRWLATLGATAVSTYALDLVATAAGAALAASGVLRGAPHLVLLGFLALTYVAWGAGLRRNLPANWELLERTGTSTNALSKAAHDLAAARGWGPRAHRAATAAGYVGTELAKEAPYYAGAFGAALVTDSVSSADAIVFLGGANLGAAVYEYGLAALTQSFLRRGHASFDDDWVPGEYLADYYACVEPDEVETIAFFTDALRETAPGEPMLFFGTGPTLHHVFLSAPRASEIHLADYLPRNLAEIDRWLQRDPEAHDWRPFVRYTLECEGLRAPTEAQLAEREELTRAKVTRLLRADARDRRPVGERYATVVSAYCADSATADHATWATYMRHIAGLVQPGGVLVTAALRRSSSYLVGGKRFPSANVDEHDLRAVLEPEFECEIEVREVPEHARLGYAGIVLARASRRPPASAPGSRLTPNRSRTPPAISRASASSSAVVPAPRLVSASVCLEEIAIPSGSPWPRWKPARSISHAADVLTRPSGSGKRGGRSGARRSSASNSGSGRIGLVKNEPAETESGSPGSSTMPLPRRRPSTASRTSASGAPSPGRTPSVRASSA